MENNYQIVINNQKVFEFYQKNTSLNFEQVNLLCIDLFDNILQDANNNVNKSINNQILSECLKNNHKLDEVNSKIEKLNSDLIFKFLDIKKDYIQEVKNIIQIQGNENFDKINQQIKENTLYIKENIENGNNQIIDKNIIQNKEFELKINNTLHSIQSDSLQKINQTIHFINEQFINKIQNIIPSQSIKEEIFKIINDEFNQFIQNQQNIQLKEKQDFTNYVQEMNKHNNNQVDQFLNTFENKYNSIMIQFIQQSAKQENNQDKIFASLQEFLDRYKNNSSSKGKFAENHLKLILEENIENAQIIDKSQTPHSCDLLLSRVGKYNILIENKIYSHKVPTNEIEKFKNDCIGIKSHGIILSQFSKFTLKYDYQIDIEQDSDNNTYIMVYVQDVKDEFYKIQLAINIIDILAISLNNLNNNNQSNNYQISKEILFEINQEFNQLILQKENINNIVKEFQKKIYLSIEDIKLPSLQKYLNFSFHSNIVQNQIICNRCKKFTAKSKVSLAAHQKNKKCLQIYNNLIQDSTKI